MMTRHNTAVSSSLIRVILALVFLGSSFSKARDLDATVSGTTRIIPSPTLARWSAWALTTIEAMLPLGYFFPNRAVQRSSLLTTDLLLKGFTGVLWKDMLSGDPRPCGCFGQHLQSITGWKAVSRNLLLLAASRFGFRSLEPQSVLQKQIVHQTDKVLTLAILIVWIHNKLSVNGTVEVDGNARLKPKAEFALAREIIVDSIQPQSSHRMLEQHRWAIVFLKSGCPACNRLQEELSGGTPIASDLALIIVSGGSEVTSMLTDYLLVEHGDDLRHQLDIKAFPSAIIYDARAEYVRDSAVGLLTVARLLREVEA